MLAPFAAAGAASTGLMLEPLLTEQPALQPVEHEEEFIRYLFQRGRVEFTPETLSLTSTGPMYARKTHRLELGPQGELTLERISFDCGFD